jgi:hypothetical protein
MSFVFGSWKTLREYNWIDSRAEHSWGTSNCGRLLLVRGVAPELMQKETLSIDTKKNPSPPTMKKKPISFPNILNRGQNNTEKEE